MRSVYTNDYRLIGSAILVLILVALTITTLQSGPPRFIHTLDFIFHEAGHVLFMPFGYLIGLMGGTLGQLMVPTAFTLYFWRKKEYVSSFAMLWWIGENLIDISLYIQDAVYRTLPLWNENLLHDWHYILIEFGSLRHALTLGAAVRFVGASIMLIAVLGIVWQIWRSTGVVGRKT
jgi:hypothetical protein